MPNLHMIQIHNLQNKNYANRQKVQRAFPDIQIHSFLDQNFYDFNMPEYIYF